MRNKDFEMAKVLATIGTFLMIATTFLIGNNISLINTGISAGELLVNTVQLVQENATEDRVTAVNELIESFQSTSINLAESIPVVNQNASNLSVVAWVFIGTSGFFAISGYIKEMRKGH